MIFLIADMHINHRNIINPDFGPHYRSQFSSIEEMNALIIHNWKDKVSENDTVYILDDIALGDPQKGSEIISSLPGKKILLMGNHDVPKIKTNKGSKAAPQDLEHLKYPMDLFSEVYPASQIVSIVYDKYTFDLNHYPPRLSPEIPFPKHHIFMHAHSHSKKEYNIRLLIQFKAPGQTKPYKGRAACLKVQTMTCACRMNDRRRDPAGIPILNIF